MLSKKRLVIRGFTALLALIGTGCAPATTRSVESTQESRPTEQATATTAPASTPAEDEAAEKEKAEKERRDLVRKQARTERDLTMARERMRKTKLQNEFNEQQEKLAEEKARRELDLAERKLRTFKEISTPERLDRADLSLQYSRDSVVEARQELEQLEGMYKDDQFADKTKEIVLERGRRRLERAERSLALEDRAIAALKGETLPVELIEQEAGVREKREAIKKLVFDNEMEAIDRKLSILGAEAELIRLEEDLEDVVRDLREFDRKAAEKARKAAEAAASQSAPEGGK